MDFDSDRIFGNNKTLVGLDLVSHTTDGYKKTIHVTPPRTKIHSSSP